MNDDFSKRGLNLRQDLLKSLRNSTQADLKIICKDGLVVRASSHLLTMRSDWFHIALCGNLKEPIRKEIILSDIASETLSSVLEYLYTGLIDSLTLSNVILIYQAAEYFDLPNLQNMIAMHVNENIADHSKAGMLLSDAVEKLDSQGPNDPLILCLLGYFWKAPLPSRSLCSLSEKALKFFVLQTHASEVKPTFDEYNLFMEIIHWVRLRANENIPKLGELHLNSGDLLHVHVAEILKSFIPYINFEDMKPSQFNAIRSNHPGLIPYDILDRCYDKLSSQIPNNLLEPITLLDDDDDDDNDVLSLLIEPLRWNTEQISSKYGLTISRDLTIVELNAINRIRTIATSKPIASIFHEFRWNVHIISLGDFASQLPILGFAVENSVVSKEPIGKTRTKGGRLVGRSWGFTCEGQPVGMGINEMDCWGIWGEGDIVSFVVVAGECRAFINGRAVGSFTGLPEKISPAATLANGSRFRISVGKV